MTESFRAILATKIGNQQSASITQLPISELMNGDVTVATDHSAINWLAITGKSPVIRKFPLIPCIDLAGTVLDSEDPRFIKGNRVALTGNGLGEMHHGGYAALARVPGDWLVHLPEKIL